MGFGMAGQSLKGAQKLNTQRLNSGSSCYEVTVSHHAIQTMSVYLYPRPVSVTSCGVTLRSEIQIGRNWFGKGPKTEREKDTKRERERELTISQ